MDRIIRPRGAAWYAAKALERQFFYAIDTRGALYLEEAVHRNVATSFKDAAFLRTFYTMMRRSGGVEDGDYPLVTTCGKEKNFVLPEDPRSVLGFTELTNGDLVFGGGQFKERFDPSLLSFSHSSGRLYHPLRETLQKHLKNELGLLHPHIAQGLAISPSPSSSYLLNWQGKLYSLKSID